MSGCECQRLRFKENNSIGHSMNETPSDLIAETIVVDAARVSCDGAGAIRGGEKFRPAALGHPRVYLQIDQRGYVDCGYCDRRFILRGGPADK